MDGQTAIEREKAGGGDPEGKVCDWCPEPATHSFEMKRRVKGKRNALVGTMMFKFACGHHYETAKRMTDDPLPPLR